MAEQIKLTTPLQDSQVEELRVGDSVLITGPLYTARDAAHKLLVELLQKGEQIPFEIQGHLIYYTGPSPARPGQVIGSSGPTTSYRMNPYAPRMLEAGSKGMIGKGEMSADVSDALRKHKGVYLAAVGGAGALIAQTIKNAEIIVYEHLGPEAIRLLHVEGFPAIVAQDCHGGNLYRQK